MKRSFFSKLKNQNSSTEVVKNPEPSVLGKVLEKASKDCSQLFPSSEWPMNGYRGNGKVLNEFF